MKKYLYLLLLIPFIFVSCGKHSDTPFKSDFSLDYLLLTDLLVSAELGITNKQFDFQMDDKEYAVISRDFLVNDFTMAFQKEIIGEGLTYKLENRDCDDFAVFALARMRKLHAQTPWGKARTGVAFGEVNYITSQGTGHAINIVILREGEGDKKRCAVHFWEPQKQQLVTLTKQEKQSIMRIRF